MNVRQFAKNMSYFKKELQDKEVLIRAENGMLFPAKVLILKKERCELSNTKDTVEAIVIGY